jgi:hypothetical protein
MSKRATLQETLDFANKVREAGGADALDALMPSSPQEPGACLIANALNFSCEISGAADDRVIGAADSWGKDRWAMHLEGAKAIEQAHKIADALSLKVKVVHDDLFYAQRNRAKILLPVEIGQVAQDFDNAADTLNQTAKTRSEKKLRNAIEMWEYIDVEERAQYYWIVEGNDLVRNPEFSE